jgi:hypothetical protein
VESDFGALRKLGWCSEAFHLPEKNGGRTGKRGLQTGGTGRESRKSLTQIVGKKPNGKSQVKYFLTILLLAGL